MKPNHQPPRAGFVAIVGRPNVGKSSIVNKILGVDLSIVSAKAQTTRDSIFAILSDETLGQCILTDTPGIHRAKKDGLNAAMVHQAARALDAPDVVWLVVQSNSDLAHEVPVFEKIRSVPRKTPIYLVINKCDLNNKKGPISEVEWSDRILADTGQRIRKVFRVSAKTGENLPELMNHTWEELPFGEALYPDPDALSDKPLRFFVAEMIRQQLFEQLDEELPYSCAVRIHSFDESGDIPKIHAEIVTERESQKAIVIGQKGRMVQKLGSEARASIEKFMGKHVFLGLQVKVIKEWTRDPNALRRLGYTLPHTGDRGRSK